MVPASVSTYPRIRLASSACLQQPLHYACESDACTLFGDGMCDAIVAIVRRGRGMGCVRQCLSVRGGVFHRGTVHRVGCRHTHTTSIPTGPPRPTRWCDFWLEMCKLFSPLPLPPNGRRQTLPGIRLQYPRGGGGGGSITGWGRVGSVRVGVSLSQQPQAVMRAPKERFVYDRKTENSARFHTN